MVKNNFDIIRILLAVMVFYFHMGILASNDFLSLFPGTFAVECFFVISGYLIVKSYVRRKDIWFYTKSRFLRIYPLYFLIITLFFIIGYLNYSSNFTDYINDGAGKYLVYNYVFANFLQPSLPELFSDNIKNVVNGSLWTIKIEVMFYLSVPIIYGFFTRYINEKSLTVLLAVSSVIFYYVMGHFVDEYGLNKSLNNQLPSVMVFFMVGAFFNFYTPKFLNAYYLLAVFPLLYLFHDIYLIYPILVGTLVYIASFHVKPIGVSKRIGDLSYGIYIWHFPILQLVILFGFFDNLLIGALLSSILVFTSAFLSWHLLESKLIRKA